MIVHLQINFQRVCKLMLLIQTKIFSCMIFFYYVKLSYKLGAAEWGVQEESLGGVTVNNDIATCGLELN